MDGYIKCIGNSLYLKNNFGGGYRVTIVIKEEKYTNNVEDLMLELFPNSTLLDSSGS